MVTTMPASTVSMTTMVSTTINHLVANKYGTLQLSDKIALFVYITVGCLGILFNSFVIKVFLSLKDKSGIKLFIVALSATDWTAATSMVLRNTIQLASSNPVSIVLVYTVLTWFTLLALLYSQYLLAMIALDRFLAIFYPMTLKMSLKTQIIVIVIGLPITGVIQGANYYAKTLDEYYYVFLSSICFSFVMMSILYILIIRRLVHHSTNHRQKTTKLFIRSKNAVKPTEVDSRTTARTIFSTSFNEHVVNKERDTRKQADYTNQEKEQTKKDDDERKIKLSSDNHKKNNGSTVAHSIATVSSSSQQQHKIHLQTVRMTVVITLAYLTSYIPWVLSSWNIIPYPRAYLQTFFINVVTSPVLYAFMNRQFKKAAFGRCIQV